MPFIQELLHLRPHLPLDLLRIAGTVPCGAIVLADRVRGLVRPGGQTADEGGTQTDGR